MKKLLFACLMLCLGVGMRAAVDIAPVNWQDLSVNTSYYFYNVEGNAFLTHGNDWGTRASLKDFQATNDFKIVVNNSNLNDSWIHLTNYASGKDLFVADGNAETIYCDNNKDARWILTLSNDGTYYTIKNKTKHTDRYLGLASGTIVNLSNTTVTDREKWVILKADDFNGNTAQLKARYNLYNRIKEAETLGVASSVIDEASTVYNDMTKAVADYEAQEATLVSYYPAITGVIPTNLIINWTASTLGDGEALHVNTWSTEGATDGSGMLTPFIENWHAKGTNLVNKTITFPVRGLEPGWYEVGGLFRCLNEAGNATPSGIYMTMNTDEYDMTDGATACNNGVYKRLSKAVRVGADGLLTIGVKVQNATVNWISWRDFTITKMPEVTQSDIDAEWAKMGPCEASVYNAALAAKTTVDDTKLPSDFASLKEAVAAAEASMAAYATVKAILDRAAAAVAKYDATGKAAYNVSAIKTAYDNGTIADADCPAKVQEVWAAWALAVKATATFADGAEVTPLIENHSFETSQLEPWTSIKAGSDYGVKANSNGTYTTAGVDGQYLFNTWGGSNLDIQQTVSLPAGLYQIKALYASDSNCNATLSANGYSVTSNAGANKGVFVEMTLNDVYVTEMRDVTISLKSFDWFKADDFRLIYVRSLSTAEIDANRWPTEAEIAAYNATVASVRLGFDEGDYAPYLNAASVTAFENAKVDLATVKAGALNAATSTINALSWTANTEEVNAVYDGTFAQAANDGAPAGWRTSHSAGLGTAYHARAMQDDRLAVFNENKKAFYMRYDGTNSDKTTVYTYGNTGAAYQMPLKAGVEYLLSLDFSGWGQLQKTKFYMTDANGATIGSIEITPSARADQNATPDRVEIEATPTVDGNCALHVSNPSGANNAIVVSNIVLKKANYDQIIYENQYTKGDINDDKKVNITDVAAEIDAIKSNKATANRHHLTAATKVGAEDVAVLASLVAADKAEEVDNLNKFIKLEAQVYAAQTAADPYSVKSLTGVVDKKDYSAQASTLVPNVLTRINVTASGISNIASISVYAKGKEQIAGHMVAKMMDGTLSYCTTSGGAASTYNGNQASDVVRLTTTDNTATIYLCPVALPNGVTVTVQTKDGSYYSADLDNVTAGAANSVTVSNADANKKGLWMATIPGKVHFNQLSLCGAHNAGTNGLSADAAKCQSKSIEDLLKLGVRALDLRPAGESASALELQHGSGFLVRQKTGIKFTTALGYVKDFLIANPSETVFLLVHNEEGDGTKWGEAVKTCLEGVQDYIKVIEGDMSLDACRGKMVVIARDNVANTKLCGKTGWGGGFSWKTVVYATDSGNTNGNTPWSLMYQDDYENTTYSSRYANVEKLFTDYIGKNATPQNVSSNNCIFINTMNIHNSPETHAKNMNKKFVDDTNNTFTANTGRWGITMGDYIADDNSSRYGFSVLKKIIFHNYDYLYNGLGK